MLSEGQVQIGSFLMGPGTNFEIMNDWNPWRRNVRADATGSRPWGHGGYSGAEFAADGVVSFSVMKRGATSTTNGWMDARNALAAVLAPVGTSGDVEVRFCLGGREYLVYGRPRMMEPDPTTIGLGFSRSQCAIAFPDSLIYAGVESVFGPLTPPVYVGGLGFNVASPIQFASTLSTSSQATIINEGTVQAGMLIRVNGPCQDVRLVMEYEDGSTSILTLLGTIPSGSYVDIDSKDRTVYLNDDTNLRGDTSGNFPLAPPGTHTLTYRATNATGSTVTGSYRSAWW